MRDILPVKVTPDNRLNGGFQSLVLKAQAGDREAMDLMIAAVRPHLDHLARPYAAGVRPAQSTADLLQECCLRAWQKLETFRVGEDDGETYALFRAWMGQMIRRLAVDAQRAQRRKRRRPSRKILSLNPTTDGNGRTLDVDPPGRGHRPSSYARGAEMDRRVRACLDEMEDPRDATIVRMHVFEGLPLTEIASRMGLGYDLVREHYWAATEVLKRALRDWL